MERQVCSQFTCEVLMMIAPDVKKAEMMGFDSMLHRNPRRSVPNTRYRIATRMDTCSISMTSDMHQSLSPEPLLIPCSSDSPRDDAMAESGETKQQSSPAQLLY